MVISEWYAHPDVLFFEKNPLFIEKLSIDSNVPEKPQSTIRHKKASRNIGRVRRSKYKYKLLKRFLTIDPAMDYSKLKGTRCESAVNWHIKYWLDKDTKDHMICEFNPYNKTFISKRGDVRRYYGKIEEVRKNRFNTNCKCRKVKKLKHRKIRHFAVDADGGLSYAYVKMACAAYSTID